MKTSSSLQYFSSNLGHDIWSIRNLGEVHILTALSCVDHILVFPSHAVVQDGKEVDKNQLRSHVPARKGTLRGELVLFSHFLGPAEKLNKEFERLEYTSSLFPSPAARSL